MNFVLNYSHGDLALTVKLMKWIGRLKAGLNHDLHLQCSQQVNVTGQFEEVEEAAKLAFNSVQRTVVPREDDRGWPHGANAAWAAAIWYVIEKVQKPWGWLEPDCAPLTPDAFDRIEAEYAAAGKPCMGAEVTKPAHRMSGIGIYPPNTLALFNRRRHINHLVFRKREEAFDSFFAAEITASAHFTNLIQNVYLTGNAPDRICPTFPDQQSLSLLDPHAVLFHRCKDGTLIDRMEEKMFPAKPQGESDSSAAPPRVAPAGSTPAPAMDSEVERLRKELADLKSKLSQAPTSEPKKRGVPMKRKPMSPEHKAKLRAAWEKRKANLTTA